MVCGQPPQISNGDVLVAAGTVYSSSIRYRCNTGYRLAGNAYRTCAIDGHWSEREPRCQKVRCPTPEVIAHGDVIGSDYTYRSSVTYECDNRHRLVGNSVRHCLATGDWSGSKPACELKQCEDPAPYLDSHLRMSGQQDFTVGSTVLLRCDDGYRLDGRIHRCTCWCFKLYFSGLNILV